MIKFSQTLKAFIADVNANANAHGFWEGSNKGEKIALMHSELSEALEAIRKGSPADEKCPEFSNEVVELADCVIRIFDYCGQFDLDIVGALSAKHAYNKNRPHKHGKQF